MKYRGLPRHIDILCAQHVSHVSYTGLECPRVIQVGSLGQTLCTQAKRPTPSKGYALGRSIAYVLPLDTRRPFRYVSRLMDREGLY